jgi:hypothetical protein
VTGSVRVGDSVLDMAVDQEGQTAVVLTGRYDVHRNRLGEFRVVHVDLEALRITHQEEHPERGPWAYDGLLPRPTDQPSATPVRHAGQGPWSGRAGRALRAVGSNPELPGEPVLLARDGTVFVTGTHDGVLRIWSVEALERLEGQPEEDPDDRQAIDLARQRWWDSDRDNRFGEITISGIAGGHNFEKIAFEFSSAHQLDIIEAAGRRLLASWRSSMPLTVIQYDNMLLSRRLLRAVVSADGIAVETSSGTAVSLEIVRGDTVITPRELDRLMADGSAAR